MRYIRLFVNLFHFNRTNWKAVALCFIAALTFWLFNALNKEYSTNLRFPLRFEFDQTQFAPARQLPQNLLINVRGNGWDLFRKYFGVRLPVLIIPLERPAETKKIVASTLPALISSQLNGIQINFVVMDTLRVQIENRVTRKVTIMADINQVSFRNNEGRIGPVEVTPDTVEVTGPASMIESLPDTLIVSVPPTRAGSTFSEGVEVTFPNLEFANRNPPVVEVSFPIGKLVQITKQVVLKIDRFPWGTIVEYDSVNASFLVPSPLIEQFDSAALQAVIPIERLEEMKHGEIKSFLPELAGLPELATVVHVDSVKVKHY
jgi:hypothetical protein